MPFKDTQYSISNHESPTQILIKIKKNVKTFLFLIKWLTIISENGNIPIPMERINTTNKNENIGFILIWFYSNTLLASIQSQVIRWHKAIQTHKHIYMVDEYLMFFEVFY